MSYSRPHYPRLGYTELSVGKADNTIVRKAASGRIIVHNVGVYSDAQLDIAHQYVEQDDVDTILQFWEDNRAIDFDFDDELGRTWVCSFVGEPLVQHAAGARKTVTVRMIRRSAEQMG